MSQDETTFDIDTLASLTGIPLRTVRYYIQEGLVDRPEGSRKGATYGSRHLEQLLAIRRWKDSGLSLERIRQLLLKRESPPREIEHARRPGTVEVVTRVIVANGVEVLVEPGASGMSPEQVREFISEVVNIHKRISTRGTK